MPFPSLMHENESESEVAQSCLTLSDPMDCSLPVLVIQFSSVQSLSRVRLFETPWTVAHQAPLSMEFFRQEYWSGLPFPSPGDLEAFGGLDNWDP